MNEAPTERLLALREQSRKGLQYLLNYLFANAEQALLGMAAKTRNKAEITEYHEAVRELRLKRRTLEQHFMAAVLAGFDGPPEPLPALDAQPEAPTAELSLGGLGVMKDALLEERIAVDNIASRARLDHRDELLLLGKGFAAETGQRRVDIDALPIGPLALSRAFMDACQTAFVSPRSRILFSRVFTRFVLDELGPFYEQCLALFPQEEEPQDTGAASGRARAHEPVALPTATREEQQAEPEKQAKSEMGWDISRTPLLAAPGKAMAMPRHLIDQLLAGMQEQLSDRKTQMGALNPKAGVQPFDVYELLNGEMERAGYTRPMALSLDVIEGINLVRMLFEHRLREQQVPQPVRKLVRLLQIPLLRAALRDPEVLANAGHPARQLFLEIGSAAADWAPAGDPDNEEFQRMAQLLVVRVLSDYDKDIALFSACLEDLRRYVKAHKGEAGDSRPPA